MEAEPLKKPLAVRCVRASTGLSIASALICFTIGLPADADLSRGIASAASASGVIASLVFAILGLKHSSPVRGRLFSEPCDRDLACSVCGHSMEGGQVTCTECGVQADALLAEDGIQLLRKVRMVAIGIILAITLAAGLTLVFLSAFTEPMAGRSAGWNLWHWFGMGATIWAGACLPGVILAWLLADLLLSTTGRWWTRYPLLAFCWPFFRSSK